MTREQYGNGQSLTRGEFVSRMQRHDDLFNAIIERLDVIEEKITRSRRFVGGVLGGSAQRYAVIGVTALGTFLAAKFGLNL